MVDRQCIDEFLDYNFIPFNKKQCIKRIFLVWIFSAIVCFIDGRYVFWIVPLGCVDILISVIFIVLSIKYSKSRISRYLVDGVFWLYMAVILNFASYRMITLYTGTCWVLLIILLSLLIICMSFLMLIVYMNIKSRKYACTEVSKKTLILSFWGGVFGIFIARVFMQGLEQQELLTILSLILLLLSFLTGIASLSLLKAWLYKRVERN